MSQKTRWIYAKRFHANSKICISVQLASQILGQLKEILSDHNTSYQPSHLFFSNEFSAGIMWIEKKVVKNVFMASTLNGKL